MNANDFSQKDYENRSRLRTRKNKPKQSQSRIRPSVFRLLSSVFCFMGFLYPVRKPTLWAETVFFAHLVTEPGSNTPVELSNGVYKLINVQYYILHIGRCSSTVEHGFRKAGVVGPIPTIGFVNFQVDTFRLGKFQALY